MLGRRITIAAALLIGVTSTLAAQPAPSARWTVGGTGGIGRTWDDESQIGSGVLAGAFARWRWLSRTDLEASLDVVTHHRSGGQFEARGHTAFLSSVLVQRFGGPATTGYVLGGVTVARHSGTAGFPANDLLIESHSTHPGYIFGGGMMFRASPRVEVGPAVRITFLTVDRDSDPWSAIMGGLRVGFR